MRSAGCPKNRTRSNLTPDERQELERFVTRGKRSAREITRARILLLTQDGRQVTDIARTLGVSRGTIYNVDKRYRTKKVRTPLVEVLEEEPRSGRPLKLDSRVAVKVTLIACSEPPTGRARWTLHLIADKLVKLGVTESISHESVRQLLKKIASSPGSRSSGA
jgi:putative transposase